MQTHLCTLVQPRVQPRVREQVPGSANATARTSASAGTGLRAQSSATANAITCCNRMCKSKCMSRHAPHPHLPPARALLALCSIGHAIDLPWLGGGKRGRREKRGRRRAVNGRRCRITSPPLHLISLIQGMQHAVHHSTAQENSRPSIKDLLGNLRSSIGISY